MYKTWLPVTISSEEKLLVKHIVMILFQITRVHYIHVAEKQIIKIIQALAQKKDLFRN